MSAIGGIMGRSVPLRAAHNDRTAAPAASVGAARTNPLSRLGIVLSGGKAVLVRIAMLGKIVGEDALVKRLGLAIKTTDEILDELELGEGARQAIESGEMVLAGTRAAEIANLDRVGLSESQLGALLSLIGERGEGLALLDLNGVNLVVGECRDLLGNQQADFWVLDGRGKMVGYRAHIGDNDVYGHTKGGGNVYELPTSRAFLVLGLAS